MTRSIILAAGKGERLMPLTADRPKCLVPLLGRSLIERQIAVLRGAGVTDITIVGGYQADRLAALGKPVIVNSDFETTNMVATLFCARDRLDGKDDIIISYGDIVYEARVFDALLECRGELCLTSDSQWRAYWQARMADPMADVETFKTGDAGRVTELGKKPESLEDIQGQYMGLFKVRADHVPAKLSTGERQRAALARGATAAPLKEIDRLEGGGCKCELLSVDNKIKHGKVLDVTVIDRHEQIGTVHRGALHHRRRAVNRPVFVGSGRKPVFDDQNRSGVAGGDRHGGGRRVGQRHGQAVRPE